MRTPQPDDRQDVPVDGGQEGDLVYVWGQDGKQPEQYTKRDSLPSFNYADPDATTTTESTTTTVAQTTRARRPPVKSTTTTPAATTTTPPTPGTTTSTAVG